MKAQPRRHVASSHDGFGLILMRVYKRRATNGVDSTRSSTVHAMMVGSTLGGSIRFEYWPSGAGMAGVVANSECVFRCVFLPTYVVMVTPGRFLRVVRWLR